MDFKILQLQQLVIEYNWASIEFLHIDLNKYSDSSSTYYLYLLISLLQRGVSIPSDLGWKEPYHSVFDEFVYGTHYADLPAELHYPGEEQLVEPIPITLNPLFYLLTCSDDVLAKTLEDIVIDPRFPSVILDLPPCNIQYILVKIMNCKREMRLDVFGQWVTKLPRIDAVLLGIFFYNIDYLKLFGDYLI